uniref:Uncharacterized protein n=1 Tax=Parascaris univalens TaxID=6257 RepID=A0A915BTQ4_PARUN
ETIRFVHSTVRSLLRRMPRPNRRHNDAAFYSNSTHRCLRSRLRCPLSSKRSNTSGVHPCRLKNKIVATKLCHPLLQEAKEVILQLRAKLEERHLIAAKILELEKALQRINESSDEILIEMENRIDDLNRDWQRRIKSENSKWQEHINELAKQKTDGENIPKMTLRADPLWRIEKRLLCFESRLKTVDQIDKNVIAIAAVFNAIDKYIPRKTCSDDDLHTARLKTSGCRSCANRERHPSLYGVVEMTETYSMCVRNLERAIKSLLEISKMPAVIGNAPDGVSSVAEVDRTVRILTDFVRKLKTSLRESHFTGSPEEPDWDE